MTSRDLVASIIGAGIGMVVALAWLPMERGIVGAAHAQRDQLPERQRFLVLAIANAIASVAVDGERTAMTANEAMDQIKLLQERLGSLEKRVTELEKKR
jgi:hypothetical protein